VALDQLSQAAPQPDRRASLGHLLNEVLILTNAWRHEGDVSGEKYHQIRHLLGEAPAVLKDWQAEALGGQDKPSA
jgi:hypothetical protein